MSCSIPMVGMENVLHGTFHRHLKNDRRFTTYESFMI